MSSLKKFFPYLLITFLVGVALASVFSIGNGHFMLLLLLSSALGVFAIVFRTKRSLYCILMLAALSMGMLRYVIWKDAPRDPTLLANIGETITLVGVIDDEPDIREGNTRLVLSVRSTEFIGTTTLAYGRVQFSVARYPEYAYGDVVRVRGKLRLPERFVEDDGSVFDYPAYLAVRGIHYEVPFPVVDIVARGHGNAVLATLFAMKHQFLDTLSTLFPEPENALLGGLLLGEKRSLGNDWQDIFKKAGIIHVVVLSGYNMTIVSEWLVAMFRFLGFYGSLSMGGLGITLFALMTGAGATVLRAAAMALIALLARATGRTYTMGRALLVAAVLMVMQNPSILAFDPSFQLSFLASLGLIVVAPVIESRTKLFARFPVWREVFVSTLATQLMVLPLLLLQTGTLSLISLPVNMLVLPVIPLTMLLGFISGVVGIVSPLLGPIAAFPTQMLLWWVLTVPEVGVHIPYAAVSLRISSSVVCLLYVLLALYLLYAHATLSRLHREAAHVSPLSSSAIDKKET